MSHTPKHRRQRSAVSTPGDRSVASARSIRSVRSTSVRSTTSVDSESGVPWNIKKQLAQDIEDEFPLASGGIALLYAQPGQPLSRFLTERNTHHGEEIYGKRGETIRDQIRDCCYKWKIKSYEDYDKNVIQRYKVVRRAGKPQRPRKIYGDSDDESSLSSAHSIFQDDNDLLSPPKAQKPPKAPKTPKVAKPPLATRSNSKPSLVGKTITTTSPPSVPTKDPPSEHTFPSFSDVSIDSKMQSFNSRKCHYSCWRLIVF